MLDYRCAGLLSYLSMCLAEFFTGVKTSTLGNKDASLVTLELRGGNSDTRLSSSDLSCCAAESPDPDARNLAESAEAPVRLARERARVTLPVVARIIAIVSRHVSCCSMPARLNDARGEPLTPETVMPSRPGDPDVSRIIPDRVRIFDGNTASPSRVQACQEACTGRSEASAESRTQRYAGRFWRTGFRWNQGFGDHSSGKLSRWKAGVEGH